MIMSKQDIVVEMVKEGKHTRQEIKDAAECTSGALATYFSGMRNAAKFTGSEICPVEIQDPGDEERKIMVVMTFEDAEERRASRVKVSAAPKKTVEERFEAVKKRIIRCNSLFDKALTRFEGNPDNEELDLRQQKADIECKLAGIEYEALSTLIDDADTEPGTKATDEDEQDIEADGELL
jgi:hypothetical protein